MSSVIGAKAISLVQREAIREHPHARVFTATGSNGDIYTIVLGAHGPLGATAICTCPAGQLGRQCYHAAAAQILARGTAASTGKGSS